MDRGVILVVHVVALERCGCVPTVMLASKRAGIAMYICRNRCIVEHMVDISCMNSRVCGILLCYRWFHGGSQLTMSEKFMPSSVLLAIVAVASPHGPLLHSS